MRKPRQIYTEQESAAIDADAQKAFEQVADGGILLPWELCRRMIELKFWQEQAKELRGEVDKLKGK